MLPRIAYLIASIIVGAYTAPAAESTQWGNSIVTSEALESFRSGAAYRVIFTDWMLPDMSGADLVQKLQQVGGKATPPIIAVTAYATADRRAEAIAAGVAGFITKPITRDKIQAALPASNGTSTAPSFAPAPTTETLRFGVLLDAENPTERIADFNAQMHRRMDEIDAALAAGEADSAARAAHQLASQVLSIHHHTFAHQLRDLEHSARYRDWDKARHLQALNRDAASGLARSLASLRSVVAPRADRVG